MRLLLTAVKASGHQSVTSKGISHRRFLRFAFYNDEDRWFLGALTLVPASFRLTSSCHLGYLLNVGNGSVGTMEVTVD